MKLSSLRFRRWALAAVSLLTLLVLVARLISVQIIRAEEYKKQMDASYISSQIIPAARGEIVDRYGRSLASNRVGFDVIIDKAFFPTTRERVEEEGLESLDQRKYRQNEVILGLTALLEQLGESWTDNLPLTDNAPFAYKEQMEQEVRRLQKFSATQSYASADDVFYWLSKRYKLDRYTPAQARKIAGIRYEMDRRGFAINVPYTFASDISITSAIRIKELAYTLPGVNVVESTIRQYNVDAIAPHIIGSIGPIYPEEYQSLADKGYAMNDLVGKSGVEHTLESRLRGINGKRQIYVDSAGKVTKVEEVQPPVPGYTVMLTLDLDLQKKAQQYLEEQIHYLQQNEPEGKGKEANAGAVVVYKVKTGELLAIATYPSYDLETYRKDYNSLLEDPDRPLLNRALLGEYAPGSIFKPVVAAAGLGQGIVDPSSTVFCGRVYEYKNHKFTCLGSHGNINVNRALQESCNIYFYDVGRRLDIDPITKVAQQMGLGLPTGIEVVENIGQLSTPATKQKVEGEPWYPGDVLQSSIGQLHHRFTPLQFAGYAATIANRGTRMEATLIHEIRDYSMKQVVEPFAAKVAQQSTISTDAFEAVIEGMVSASRIGTARRHFGAYPVDVASKTGTPETARLPNSTFIAFAPAQDPEIAVAVVIEKGWHGYTGAPVAKRLFDAYFGYDQPAPPAPESEEQNPEEIQQDTATENQGQGEQTPENTPIIGENSQSG